jgi:hypothetical protein
MNLYEFDFLILRFPIKFLTGWVFAIRFDLVLVGFETQVAKGIDTQDEDLFI